MKKILDFNKNIKYLLVMGILIVTVGCSEEVVTKGAEITFNGPSSVTLNSDGENITGKFAKVDSMKHNELIDEPVYEIKIGKIKVENNVEKNEYKVLLGTAKSDNNSNEVTFYIKKTLSPNEKDEENNIFKKDNLTTGQYNIYINSYFPIYKTRSDEITQKVEVGKN